MMIEKTIVRPSHQASEFRGLLMVDMPHGVRKLILADGVELVGGSST